MAEPVGPGRVRFVEGVAKYGSSDLLPQGLYVHTVWRCPTPGYRIELTIGNAGINPPPGVLPLRPEVRPPDGTVTQVETDVRVLYVGGDDHPDAVWIQGLDGETLKVEPL